MKTTITTTGGKGRPKNPYETLDKIYTEVYNHFERTVQTHDCYLPSCGRSICIGETVKIETGHNKDGNFDWRFVQCKECIKKPQAK